MSRRGLTLGLLVRCGVTVPAETSAATLAIQGGRRLSAAPRRPVRPVRVGGFSGTMPYVPNVERVEPASALTDVALSAEGRTVTWRNGGVERSALLP